MALAQNGDVIIAGFVPSERGPSDAWVARFNQQGDEVWSRAFGTPVRDEALDVAIMDDGSILIAGWTEASALHGQGFAARLNAQGDVLWRVPVGDTQMSSAAYRIESIGGRSILVISAINLSGGGQRQAMLTALDADGTSLWRFIREATPPSESRVVSISNSPAIVTRRDEGDFEVRAHALDTEGCVVVEANSGGILDTPCKTLPVQGAGFSATPVKFDGSGTNAMYTGDPVIRMFAATGAPLWERVLPSEDGDGIISVAETPDGGVIGAGYRVSPLPVGRHNWDGILVKLDPTGAVVWRHVFGGPRRDQLRSVAVLPDGSIIVAGYTGDAAGEWSPWIMRLNAGGKLDD